MKTRKRIKKKAIILLILFVILLIVSYFVCKMLINNIYGESKYLTIELNGDSEITLKYNDEYKDLGAKAHYKDEDISKDIKIDNNLNTSKVGEYSYTYKIKYKSQTKEIKRNIKVIDDDKPTLKLSGREELSMVIGNKYKEYGAVANDKYDGDITDRIEIDTSALDTNKIGSYKVKYIIKDSSGNKTELERKVNVVNKPSQNQKIPVLNYHFFYKDKSEKCNQNICLQVDKFKEQLKYLKDNGFYTVTMQEFVDWMYGEIDLPQKSVLITIDDGNFGTSINNGNHLIPALEEYKTYATIFIVSGWYASYEYPSDYLDVQSHTHKLHVEGKNCKYRSKVNCVSYDELLNDLKMSIASVDNANSFCFPYYEYTDTSIKAVKDAGFKLAFVGDWRKASRNDNKYKIPRYPIYDDTSLTTFKNLVN